MGVNDGPAGPPPNHESLSKYGGGITLVVFPLSLVWTTASTVVQGCAVPQWPSLAIYFGWEYTTLYPG